MINFKDLIDVVIPALVLGVMLAGVMLDYKRRLRMSGKRFKH